MKLQKTEKREKIVKALQGADKGMTLAEISTAIGEDVKSGTTNAMVSAGVLKKVGTVKVPVVRYVERDVYALGDTELSDGKSEAKPLIAKN